jgi:hypothetical protein
VRGAQRGRRAPGRFSTTSSPRRQAPAAGDADRPPDHPAVPGVRLRRGRQQAIAPADPLLRLRVNADREGFSAFRIRHMDPTVHPHLLDVGSAAVAFPLLQDSGAGRRRAVFNRRVPQAQPGGYRATRQSRSAASPQRAADVPAGGKAA